MKKTLVLSFLSLVVFPSSGFAYNDHAYCREYTKSVMVGNQLQEGYGTACLQPDGAWKVVEEAQPAPAVVTTTYSTNYAVPLPAVNEPMWGSRTYYRNARPRYTHPRTSSGLVVGFNFDSGSFFSAPRYRDYDRRDYRRDKGRYHHEHNRGRGRGHDKRHH